MLRFALLCGLFLTLISAGVVSATYALGRWQPSTELAYICEYQQVCLTDADRGRIIHLTNPNYSAQEIAWSPDGEQLVSSGNSYEASGIHMIDLASGEVRLFAAGGYWPAWSPDGQRLAYAGQWNGEWILYIHPLNGQPIGILNSPYLIANPVWSPDGKRLLFQLQEADYWHTHLAVINADASGFQTLIDGDPTYFDPVWSPDGTKIATFWSGTGAGDIVIMDAESGEVLSTIGQDWAYDGSPSWSPDGRRIAFDSDRSRGYWSPEMWAIYVANADGSNAYYVDTGTHPTWRPDSR